MYKFGLSVLVASLVLGGCSSHVHTIGAGQAPVPHNTHHQAGNHHDHGWNYQHPELWGDLEVNKLCGAGLEQSPINIAQVNNDPAKAFVLTENYHAQDFTVKNNGHTIVFDVKGAKQSHILVDGVRYELLQFHYHVPSEHTVMSTHYPLEIHFVHQNAEGGLAVVGVLVNSGAYNGNLNRIITQLPVEGKQTVLESFDINTLLPKDTTVYAYQGSLTTPPCSEKVQWLLKATPIEANSAQLTILSELYNGNNRPVQPQGGRNVLLIK